MAQLIKFPRAFVRQADYRHEKVGWLTRIDMSCELTQPLSVALGCLDMIDVESAGGVVDLKKVPDIYLKRLTLQVDGMPQVLELGNVSMSDWKFVNHFDDNKDVEWRELRFHVLSPGPAILLLEGYTREVKQTPGILEVETTNAPEVTPIAHQQRTDGGEDPVMPDKKKGRGRPPGSKNKPKRPPTEAEPAASVEK